MADDNILSGLSSAPKKKREIKAFYNEEGDKIPVTEKTPTELLYEVIDEAEAEISKEAEEDFTSLIEEVDPPKVEATEKPKRRRGPKRNPLPHVKRTMCTTLITTSVYDEFRDLLRRQGRKISDTIEIMIKDFLEKNS